MDEDEDLVIDEAPKSKKRKKLPSKSIKLRLSISSNPDTGTAEVTNTVVYDPHQDNRGFANTSTQEAIAGMDAAGAATEVAMFDGLMCSRNVVNVNGDIRKTSSKTGDESLTKKAVHSSSKVRLSVCSPPAKHVVVYSVFET